MILIRSKSSFKTCILWRKRILRFVFIAVIKILLKNQNVSMGSFVFIAVLGLILNVLHTPKELTVSTLIKVKLNKADLKRRFQY